MFQCDAATIVSGFGKGDPTSGQKRRSSGIAPFFKCRIRPVSELLIVARLLTFNPYRR